MNADVLGNIAREKKKYRDETGVCKTRTYQS